MAAWARPGSGGEKVGKNPTDRGKPGTKTSLLVDEQGGPLGAVIDGANTETQPFVVADGKPPEQFGVAPVPGKTTTNQTRPLPEPFDVTFVLGRTGTGHTLQLLEDKVDSSIRHSSASPGAKYFY